MRGRVSAVDSVFIGASNELGEFESGATAWLWPVGSVVLGGLGTIVVAALWLRLFPDLARRDALVRPGTAAAVGPAAEVAGSDSATGHSGAAARGR